MTRHINYVLGSAGFDMNYYLIKTSLGWCGLISDNDIIKTLILPSPDKSLILKTPKTRVSPQNKALVRPTVPPRRDCGRFVRDLKKYFNGKKVDFWNTKILTPYPYKIDLRDRSNFERKVYQILRKIPYGQIRTYQWVARRVGSPRASRAVGNALARNPLPIIIPCHRVIRSDGSLGKFSASGGVRLKEKLLKLEIQTSDPRPRFHRGR
jgi:O-6-methylguanine DNA methyltransferase